MIWTYFYTTKTFRKTPFLSLFQPVSICLLLSFARKKSSKFHFSVSLNSLDSISPLSTAKKNYLSDLGNIFSLILGLDRNKQSFFGESSFDTSSSRKFKFLFTYLYSQSLQVNYSQVFQFTKQSGKQPCLKDTFDLWQHYFRSFKNADKDFSLTGTAKTRVVSCLVADWADYVS